MRVLLINPPSPAGTTINREGAAGFGNRYESEGAFLYPPQTLVTTAAVLKEAGHAPALLDATAEGLNVQQTLARIDAISPDVVSVMLSWSGWEDDLFFCEVLRAARPALRLITLGTILRARARAEEATRVSDLVLVGEPERALPAACEMAQTRSHQSAQIVMAKELAPAEYDTRGYLADLERLPLPAWDLVPLERYRMVTMLSSRGCNEGCLYCPYVIGWGDHFRACSPKRVVDELAWLAKRFKPARLMFRDPVFGHDRARVVGICQEIMARKLRISWECESRPEHFDAELLALMRRAGCATIKVGLESADPQRLLAVGRVRIIEEAGAYLAKLRDIMLTCRRIGLRCYLFVMVGWPDASDAEMETTAAFLRELKPEHLAVKVVESYPCTPWAEAGGRADREAARRHEAMLRTVASSSPKKRYSFWHKGSSWLKKYILGDLDVCLRINWGGRDKCA